MCGICGIVGSGPLERDVLARMTGTLRHRGPDDEGFLHREYEGGLAVGLGFRRLSIIDLESGNQPMTNEDGSIQLLLNGEIYNFRELRRDLETRGHRFLTNADTEVVAHLYEEEGARCLTRLNGMFALALWDEPKRQLTLARDRFGKKPLHYAEIESGLIFGSELRSLLEHPSCPRALDDASLSRYLTLEYVPTPHTIYEGVKKLPAGHLLRWQDGASQIESYWDLTFEPGDGRSDDEYVEEFRSHFREAVRRRLVADVPLGAFLSGGIDSSSVVAMMVEEGGADAVKTFSVGFREASFDESRHARRVAAHFGTEHHEEHFTAQTLLDVLPTLTEVLDEPFADPSVLPTFVLSRFTRETVTVALGGDGCDELLAGYPTFPADKVARLYKVPRALHERVLVPATDRLPASTKNFSWDFKVKRFLRGAAASEDIRHALWLGALSPDEQTVVLAHSRTDPLDEYRRVYRDAPTADRIDRLVYLYAKTYLQDDILVKVDRASMACSLEVRAPFLDVDLVEFLGRVPSRLKLHRFETKHLLKRALGDRLPEGIAGRRKKGFGIPVAEWLKGELRDLLGDELSSERLRAQGIFEPAEVQRLVREHAAGRRDQRKPLWTLLMFQLWHR
ncbi:MAG TPA: asparagine synthase (glutamine-hydrolyzing), partial [Gaiellaceae bacterium]|nr:asparagine synthase (glutamine-hydrolyzing) [Gaiellaceae bacterium]